MGVRHCVTCGNGTDALTLALMSCHIGPVDAVFVPDITFFASAETVSVPGAMPVFVDVGVDSFNIDPARLETAIGRVKQEGRLTPHMILPVDLFGLSADYPAITGIADKYGLLILEDGAQGFGGAISDQRAYSFGNIASTSFFPAKPLGCYGDGGAVFTNDDIQAALIHCLGVHGKGDSKYDNLRLRMNPRLYTIQATVPDVKMDAFETTELQGG